MKILVGCDPELFVKDVKTGNPRSAHGLVQGDKKNPFKVDKGAYQVDGMALEFNIDPAETEDEFVDNITAVMRRLRQDVSSDYEFAIVPSVRFNAAHMKAQPEEAKELGCEPDYNAYTLQENKKPNAATTLRTASGHIHIGITEGQDPKDEMHFQRMATLVKHLDLFLGVRSLEWDKDQKRRELYGNPGAMRVKPYGVEYRVLSNAWLKDEKLVRLVYQQVIACINDLRTNGALEDSDYKNFSQAIRNGGIAFYKKYSQKAYAAMKAAGIYVPEAKAKSRTFYFDDKVVYAA